MVKLLLSLLILITFLLAQNQLDSIHVIKHMNYKEMKEFARIYNLPVNMKKRYYPDFLEVGAYTKPDKGSVIQGSGYRLIKKTYKPVNKDSSKYIPDKKYDHGYDPGSCPHLFYKADINNDGYPEFIHMMYFTFINEKYNGFAIHHIFSLHEDNRLIDFDYDHVHKLNTGERQIYSFFPGKPFIFTKNNKTFLKIFDPYISFDDFGIYSTEYEAYVYRKYTTEVFDDYYTLLWENDSVKVVDYKKVVHKKIKPPKRPKYKEPDYEYDLKITGTDSIESLKIIKVPVKNKKK